jgi:uncharacterized membrane protein
MCSMVTGDSLYFMAAARIGVSRALPIASAFPLLTTLGAVVLLNEPPTAALIAGSALVVLAVALIGGERARGGGRIDVIGLLLAGLAACMWAASGLFLGPALKILDPTAANMIRFPIGAIVFTVYLAAVRPSEHLTSRLVWLSLAAAIGTLASAMLFLGGIAAAGVARGVALNATSPVFSAVLAAFLLRERQQKSRAGHRLQCAGHRTARRVSTPPKFAWVVRVVAFGFRRHRQLSEPTPSAPPSSRRAVSSGETPPASTRSSNGTYSGTGGGNRHLVHAAPNGERPSIFVNHLTNRRQLSSDRVSAPPLIRLG